MSNIYNAGQLATMIKQLCQNDIEDLGNDDAQTSFIFQYMNIVLQELARTASLETFSDALAVTTAGYYTFLKDGISISDTLFEPMTILTASEQQVQKRTSYEAPTGWYRGSILQGIHLKGLTAGNYTLKYLRYPKVITLAADEVEFPSSGNATLCKSVVTLIKLSKNSYGGAEFMNGLVKQGLGMAAQGSISAKGTGSSGQPLGPVDVAIQRGV